MNPSTFQGVATPDLPIEPIHAILTLTGIWTEISDGFSDAEHASIHLIFRMIEEKAQAALTVLDEGAGL